MARTRARTCLQSCPPELCSLICQDPILERLDLNFICYISHAFQNEAQRENFPAIVIPCLRGASEIKAWCSALQSKPSLTKNVKDLVLLFPRPTSSDFRKEDIERLAGTMNTCVNLKELEVILINVLESKILRVRQTLRCRLIFCPLLFMGSS